jgi:predicted kinase
VTTLTLTRGLPGSGKTTWARAQPGAVRVNRDDLRQMLHGGPLPFGWAEVQVAVAQRAAVEALLTAGVNVICDDTNLRRRHLRDLAEIGWRCGADVIVKDFTDVPVEVCVERDAARPGAGRVGAETIRSLWHRHIEGRTFAELERLPVPPADRPRAVIIDLDGTLALLNGRSPYDEDRVGADGPNHAVIEVVQAMHAAGHRLIFCSGRTERARRASLDWLRRHVGVPVEALHLRSSGDHRPDTVVKAEIYRQWIKDRYQVVGVFEDRASVVRMWRALGLTVFQVAEGNF